MNTFDPDAHSAPDDLDGRLRAERPELSADQLVCVRRRVERRTATPSSGRMSSAAIAACLGLGVIFSGSGTALAVSGLAGDGSALRQQYAAPVPAAPADGGQAPAAAPTVGGETASGGDDTTSDDNGDDSAVAGETTSGNDDDATNGASTGDAPTNAPQSAVAGETVSGGDAVGGDDTAGAGAGAPVSAPANLNATGQIAATQGPGSELPFTGLSAIPVLLLGASLLLVGIGMRRRTRTSPF